MLHEFYQTISCVSTCTMLGCSHAELRFAWILSIRLMDIDALQSFLEKGNAAKFPSSPKCQNKAKQALTEGCQHQAKQALSEGPAQCLPAPPPHIPGLGQTMSFKPGGPSLGSGHVRQDSAGWQLELGLRPQSWEAKRQGLPEGEVWLIAGRKGIGQLTTLTCAARDQTKKRNS